MKIAILTGGESSEREIALRSAENVAKAATGKYEVEIFDLPADLDRFISLRSNFAATIPVFHGKGGEDGVVQGMLRTLKVPFIFSDVEAHAIGLNKIVTKLLVKSTDIATPDFKSLYSKDETKYIHPVVIKPNDGGSSIGIRIARDQNQLDDAVAAARQLCDQVLVEDFVTGDEFTVAVIDDQNQTIPLPVIQIKSQNEFFDLESKYDAKLAEEICPAKIDDQLADKLQKPPYKFINLLELAT